MAHITDWYNEWENYMWLDPDGEVKLKRAKPVRRMSPTQISPIIEEVPNQSVKTPELIELYKIFSKDELSKLRKDNPELTLFLSDEQCYILLYKQRK